jgi:hypothetical protein
MNLLWTFMSRDNLQKSEVISCVLGLSTRWSRLLWEIRSVVNNIHTGPTIIEFQRSRIQIKSPYGPRSRNWVTMMRISYRQPSRLQSQREHTQDAHRPLDFRHRYTGEWIVGDSRRCGWQDCGLDLVYYQEKTLLAVRAYYLSFWTRPDVVWGSERNIVGQRAEKRWQYGQICRWGNCLFKLGECTHLIWADFTQVTICFPRREQYGCQSGVSRVPKCL